MAGWHILHHGLGSLLQAGRQALTVVAWPRVVEETLLVYSTQLSLHVFAPRDETGRQTAAIRPPPLDEQHRPAEGALTLC